MWILVTNLTSGGCIHQYDYGIYFASNEVSRAESIDSEQVVHNAYSLCLGTLARTRLPMYISFHHARSARPRLETFCQVVILPGDVSRQNRPKFRTVNTASCTNDDIKQWNSAMYTEVHLQGAYIAWSYDCSCPIGHHWIIISQAIAYCTIPNTFFSGFKLFQQSEVPRHCSPAGFDMSNMSQI